MGSGRTLWEELVRHYRRGAEEARALEERWTALRGKVDAERHRAVLAKLQRQADDAGAWRDEVPRLLPDLQPASPCGGRIRKRAGRARPGRRLGLADARGAGRAAGLSGPGQAFEARAADLVSRMTVEEKVSQLMNDAPAIPRLGIPAYEWWNECLHGVARAGAATVFPQAIGLAASFDTNADARGGDRDQRRGARQAPRVRAARRSGRATRA